MNKLSLQLDRVKYRFKRWLTLDRAIFIVAVAFCLVWTWGAISAMTRNWELEQTLVAKRKELELTRLEVDTLELENQYYTTEEYQELAGRDKLNKIAPGEQLVYLPDNSEAAKNKHKETAEAAAQPEAGENEETIIKPSNFNQWLQFIFGA